MEPDWPDELLKKHKKVLIQPSPDQSSNEARSRRSAPSPRWLSPLTVSCRMKINCEENTVVYHDFANHIPVKSRPSVLICPKLLFQPQHHESLAFGHSLRPSELAIALTKQR